MRFQPYYRPGSMSHRFRTKRAEHIKKIVRFVRQGGKTCRILDLGGTRTYWEVLGNFAEKHDCHITILNRTFDALERDDGGDTRNARYRHVIGDVCAVDFPDGAFDLVHSNSVIEHVGDWRKMEAMAREVRRLAPCYYLQVPYFWFPLEPHFQTAFFHWIPEQTRMRWIMRSNLGWHKRAGSVGEAMLKVQDARLLDKRQLEALLPDGTVFFERFMGLPKSLIAVRSDNPAEPPSFVRSG